MKNLPIILIMVFGAVNACTWVKPTEEGEKVIVVNPEHVTTCRKLATTTFGVKHKIGSRERKEEKVTEELVTLARNEAAMKGGDAIVSQGPVQDGSMTFDIYRCASNEIAK